ncbi:MAG: NADH-quinone oxidoreductase subunit C [Kiritimatiellota bacterium]|nr:NADH-quinone oxidoreductase subunit C [Kiritimatiellota bacterium]
MNFESLLAAVNAIEPEAVKREQCDRAAVNVPTAALFKLMQRLRDDPQLAFDMLCTHTAIDYPAENRIELVYQLYSIKHRHYLMVATAIPRDRPEASTLSPVWKIAEWQEREVYDLFGVLYSGHPDLRRLFLDDDWQGFPLRKDYKDDFMLERPQ